MDMEHNTPVSEYGIYAVTSINGEKVTLQQRNLTSMTSARWPKSTSTVISHADNMHPWLNVIKMALPLHGPPPHVPSLQSSSWGKNGQTIPTERHATECLAGTLQNQQGHWEQGKSEKLSECRGVYSDMMTKCNVDPGTDKNTRWKQRTLEQTCV